MMMMMRYVRTLAWATTVAAVCLIGQPSLAQPEEDDSATQDEVVEEFEEAIIVLGSR